MLVHGHRPGPCRPAARCAVQVRRDNCIQEAMRPKIRPPQGLHERILDNETHAVMLLDDQVRLAYLNPAGEMLLSASARRVTGQPLAEILPGEPALIEAFRDSLASGHPFTERERRLELPGERNVTVDCSVTPLHDPHLGYALLVEMAQVDRHLRIEREEQLINQHAATRALIRGMAHEIKNPLGGLRGAAQLLEAELDDESLKEYTGIIIHEADRLRNLVNRLLGPHSRPQKRMVNIHEVLERVRQLLGIEAPDGIRIVRDYDPSIPELYADPDQLIQAILNIGRNAIQALGEHGELRLATRVLRQYTLGNRRHKLVAKIAITDDGPGIPETLMEQIFYPMVSGRAGGSGLGLSIAQSLMAQHDGLIECDSRPGRTTFTLLIPVENPDDTDR